MNNDELINYILNSLSTEELVDLAKYMKIRIGGFREVSNKIPRIFLINGIKLNLLKKAIQPISDINEYTQLYDINKNDFYIHVLSDLNFSRNYDVVKSVVNNVLKINSEENVDYVSSDDDNIYDKLRNENEKLKKENEFLHNEIKKIRRETKKEIEEITKKHLIDLKNEKEKIKNQKQLQEKIDNISEEYYKLVSNNKILEDKLVDYEKNIIRIAYLQKFFEVKNLLLLNLKPLDEAFPYKYNVITIDKIYKSQLPEVRITDLWIKKGFKNDFVLTQIILILSKVYSNINITFLNDEELERLGVGVVNG